MIKWLWNNLIKCLKWDCCINFSLVVWIIVLNATFIFGWMRNTEWTDWYRKDLLFSKWALKFCILLYTFFFPRMLSFIRYTIKPVFCDLPREHWNRARVTYDRWSLKTGLMKMHLWRDIKIKVTEYKLLLNRGGL